MSGSKRKDSDSSSRGRMGRFEWLDIVIIILIITLIFLIIIVILIIITRKFSAQAERATTVATANTVGAEAGRIIKIGDRL